MSDLSSGELHDYLESLVADPPPRTGESVNDVKAFLEAINESRTSLPADSGGNYSGGTCTVHTVANYQYSGPEDIGSIKDFITDPGKNYSSTCTCNTNTQTVCVCNSRCSCDNRTACSCNNKAAPPDIGSNAPTCDCDNRIFACRCRGRCECEGRTADITGCTCNDRCRCNTQQVFSE